MKDLLLILGGVWVLIAAFGRSLLLDELKGWMSSRRDRAVEEAIASLSEDERALFEEDWRATYAKFKDRPLSAWRCAREFRLSARNLATNQADLGESDDVSHANETRAGEGTARPLATKRSDKTRRLPRLQVVRHFLGLVKGWTEIDFDAIGAPFPSSTLTLVVPGLRAIRVLLALGSAVSGLSVSIALQYVTGVSLLVAVPAALALAAAAWSMNRFVAVSILSRGGFLVASIPLLLLSAAVSLAVAQPLLIRVFSTEIATQVGHSPGFLQAMSALDTVGANNPWLLATRWVLTSMLLVYGMAPILTSLLLAGRIRKLWAGDRAGPTDLSHE